MYDVGCTTGRSYGVDHIVHRTSYTVHRTFLLLCRNEKNLSLFIPAFFCDSL